MAVKLTNRKTMVTGSCKSWNTCAIEETDRVIAKCVFVTSMLACQTLVDVLTFSSIASKPTRTLASKGSGNVFTDGVWMAIIIPIIRWAFVHIVTVRPVSFVSNWTVATVRSIRVLALCVFITRVLVRFALIHVRTSFSVACVACVTVTFIWTTCIGAFAVCAASLDILAFIHICDYAIGKRQGGGSLVVKRYGYSHFWLVHAGWHIILVYTNRNFLPNIWSTKVEMAWQEQLLFPLMSFGPGRGGGGVGEGEGEGKGWC